MPRWRLLAICLAGWIGLAAGLAGYGTGLDRTLRDADWNVRQTGASGTIHVVEIDARSIAAIDKWPWPRRNYVRVIERLREAGAASISFDVDFSSPSNPADDSALAGAVRQAGGRVALPTFVQQSGGGTTGWTEFQPIPALREHAAQAAVSVLPDRDGVVRRMPYGVAVGGLPRPSLSALVAGEGGSAGADFPIDFAIDPGSIPRHSFIDIRDGRFDPDAVRGKHILIGATAVELGDRYAVPRHGVIPGVLIQALASETLLRGRPREAGWPGPLLLVLIAGSVLLRARSWPGFAFGWFAAWPTFVAIAASLDRIWRWNLELGPAAIAWLVLGVGAAGLRLLTEARRRRRIDGQTGMPNRLAFAEALGADPAAGVTIAKVVDLEKLSAGLGGTATGVLIQRIADRIATVVPGRTIYRIKDSALAWTSLPGEDRDGQIATLRTFMMSPLEVSGRRVDVTLGFGHAAARDGEPPTRTIENASLAAAQAIAEGSACHEFSPTDAEAVDLELSLLGELDEAIAAGQIEVHYQPKLDLGSRRIVSVEALVRWPHPVRGFLRPDLFVPLAERNDRIGGLTLHVVATALRDLRTWHAAGHYLTSAVNISAKLLRDDLFIARLQAMIRDSGVATEWLALEITESAAMHDPEIAAAALRSFRDMGIAISMDDYGTGHSSLSYLRQLPLSELKIDRSFVQHAHLRRADGALVRSTVDLAHELGLKVVAEGVEDVECLEFLAAIGCDLAQGYLIARPMPGPRLVELLESARAAA